MSTRPRVLYVAWGFPPMSGGGTYRTLATANLLHEAGFEVHVLTALRSAYVGFTGVDDALTAAIHPEVRVHRIPFDNPYFDRDIRTWPPERIAEPAPWSEARQGRIHAGFPEHRFGTWHEPLIEAAERLQKEIGFQLTVASANPHVVMTAGDHLFRTHGVPHVIDHRDAWRLNCYTGMEQHSTDPRVAELETEYFRTAQQIWFVNEAIRDWHQRAYPELADKMIVVENGYDEHFAPRPRLEPSPPNQPLTMSYVGSIGAQVPVVEFVEGWMTARDLYPELADARAEIYGPLATQDRSRERMLGHAQKYGITHRGRVSKADVARVYESSDALLLILGGGRYVTSGKVYEYLSSALPVVSVHAPENGAAQVLDGYPLWHACEDLSPEAVAHALGGAARAARTATHEQRTLAHEFGRRAERHAQLRKPIADLYGAVMSEALR